MMSSKTYDVLIVGAGVFGAWTALQLKRRGVTVALLDAFGPANSRASSGGETRLIRMGYGKDEIYSRWAMRALPMWQELSERGREPLFHKTGILWLAHKTDGYEQDCLATLRKLGAPITTVSREELSRSYPQFNLDSVTWALLEPESGVLMARRAVQSVAAESCRLGVEYIQAQALAPQETGRINYLTLGNGEEISAGTFVFACGAWLPKVFPHLLGDRIFPTRQEVFFFGIPAGNRSFAAPALPAWINFDDGEAYGMPDLESRGLKIAIDRHGERFDPDTGSRIISGAGQDEVRGYVRRLFPEMKEAPVVETRVCQYENTSNGDFLVDRHPSCENMWLVGGGSGHGFKHGPVMGEYVATRIIDGGAVEPRFTLGTKDPIQHRTIR